jgi:hypothetical protein
VHRANLTPLHASPFTYYCVNYSLTVVRFLFIGLRVVRVPPSDWTLFSCIDSHLYLFLNQTYLSSLFVYAEFFGLASVNYHRILLCLIGVWIPDSQLVKALLHSVGGITSVMVLISVVER